MLVSVRVLVLASGESVPFIVMNVIVGLAFMVTVSPAVIVTLSVVWGVVLLQLDQVPAVAQFPVPPLKFEVHAKSEAICHWACSSYILLPLVSRTLIRPSV